MAKCKICNKQWGKGEGYIRLHMSDSGNVYKYTYCSEDEYNAHVKELEYKNKSYDLLKDYMGYSNNQVLPSVVVKEIMSLRNGYSYRAIYNVLVEMEQNIRYWMGQENKFNNDYSKAKYLLALLSNNINDIYNKLKREAKIERKREDEQHVDIDIINHVEDFDNVVKPTRKVNDISDFLD